MFIDPADFVKVLRGQLQPDQRQPYTGMNLNNYFFAPSQNSCDRVMVNGAAYDRLNNRIFMPENIGANVVIHVFQLSE